jgi:protein-disulfide isomerase
MSLTCKKSAVYRLLIATLICTVLTLSASAQGTRGVPNPFSKGDADAPFQIEVFYDFQCPSCAVYHETLIKTTENHADKVRITFRHFPLVKIHDKAYEAALAVEAAGDQGKFWEMADLMLRNQKKWSSSTQYLKMFSGYAKALKLDLERFEEYRAGIAVTGRVDLDIQRAKSLEITAVPTVILNGRKLSMVEAAELEGIISKGN